MALLKTLNWPTTLTPTGVPGVNALNPVKMGQPPVAGLNNIETKTTDVTQNPTNVYTGAQYSIPGILNRISAQNQNIGQPTFGNVNLNQNFQGAPQLNGGIDLFGRMALAEGAQNIGLQGSQANQTLSNQLGRRPGNASLLAVLQGQNALRSQLAVNPLYAEAQKGTYERGVSNTNLNNQALQLANTAQTTQAGFNNQNQLQAFQSRLAALQPNQNLLEALISLQSQARGLTSSEDTTGAKNFK
jgi:hypothetical protein